MSRVSYGIIRLNMSLHPEPTQLCYSRRQKFESEDIKMSYISNNSSRVLPKFNVGWRFLGTLIYRL